MEQQQLVESMAEKANLQQPSYCFRIKGENSLTFNENTGNKNNTETKANNYLTPDTKLFYLSAPALRNSQLITLLSMNEIEFDSQERTIEKYPPYSPLSTVLSGEPDTEYTKECIQCPVLMTLRIQEQITS